MLKIEILRCSPLDFPSDGIIFGLYQDKIDHYITQGTVFDSSLHKGIQSILQDKSFTGKLKDINLLPTYGLLPTKNIILAGLGSSSRFTTHHLRVVMAAAMKSALKMNITNLSLLYTAIEGVSLADWVQAAIEGIELSAYRAPSYHQQKKEIRSVEKLTVILPAELDDVSQQEAQLGVQRGHAYAAGTIKARDLVNMPGNYLTPSVLAELAVEVGTRYGMTSHVLDELALQEKGMGALWAVGKGSILPPRMIVLQYEGDQDSSEWLALVGKGITFDTGGYSLKPKEGMEKMINDMGGAAAVIGAMETIGRLKPKKNIMAVIPAAENMISGGAFKPGDVLTSYSGKTIEMVNSDAEGRLVLADGLTYAKELGATRIVDVATLTGGVVVAFGTLRSGAVTNNEEFYREVETAAAKHDERIWQLPHDQEYRDRLKSSVADLINSTGRHGHALMAGLFIGEFAEQTPWVHLDIAGTAFEDKAHDLGPQGGTGVMSRTLATLSGCLLD
jgi:leucyl aminopeptidase